MQYPEEKVVDFVAALHTASTSGSKPLLRSTLYTVPSTPEDPVEHHILSWKTQEFAYRQFSQDSNELPTLARGLFTEETTQSDGLHARIVARGYDKFFNQGELSWTRSEALATYTTGPYVLTYKENGCIIFAAALTPNRLLVTSKHAIGSRPDDEKTSHADMGATWLRHHLSRCGKTEAQLAAELWRRNETAVMELCDDSFEEHVLAYSPERTGLHLHGLNANTPQFSTRPIEQVNEFAQSWGFMPVRYKVLDTYAEVEAFAKKVGETGALDGEPIEGFVVRTTMPAMDGPPPSGVVKPPYAAGQTWFYKIKFDEPYLMYRNWRELTRTMLHQKADYDALQATLLALQTSEMRVLDVQEDAETPSNASPTPEIPTEALSKNALKRAKKQALKARKDQQEKDRANGRAPPDPPMPRTRRPETTLYVEWCYDRLYGNAERGVEPQPQLFAHFLEGRGIIALRDAFLEYKASKEGQEALRRHEKGTASIIRDLRMDERPYSKTLIVPIAVVGCGKTALCVALSRLFGWSHIQSDDVQAKRTGPLFLKHLEQALLTSDVVLADRNNHLLKHREEIVDMVRRLSDPTKGKVGRVRLVALAWQVDGLPHALVQQVCANRMRHRGDRHQCLRVDPDEPFQYDTILTRFIKEMQSFQCAQSGEGTAGACDAQFDEHMWIDVEATFESVLKQTLEWLCPLLDLAMPSREAVADAQDVALSYRPLVQKETPKLPALSKDAVLATSYLGIFVNIDVPAFVQKKLDELPLSDKTASARQALYTILVKQRAISQPHVTLLHREDVKQHPPLEQVWDNLNAAIDAQPQAPRFTLQVDGVAWNNSVMALHVAHIIPHDMEQSSWPSFQKTMHITVGLVHPEAKAYEANQLWSSALSMQLDWDPVPLTGHLALHSNPK